MEHLTELIRDNLQYAPYITFTALLLAGIGLPISEDALIFINAVLASDYPKYIPWLYLGLLTGGYLSDFIPYFLGKKFGHKLWDFPRVERLVPKKKVSHIYHFYKKYGVFTLIFGRFIPFGVRNALFFTAGLVKMKFLKFVLADLLAASISITFFFTIYYKFGPDVIRYVKKGNLILIAALVISLSVYLYFRFKRQPQDKEQSK